MLQQQIFATALKKQTFNISFFSTDNIAVIYSKQIAASVSNGMNIEFNKDNSWETTLKFNPEFKVSKKKRVMTFTKKIIPKSIL